MCSVGDDFENDGEKLMEQIDQFKISDRKCNKCRSAIPIILLRHKDAYCKDCFLTATNHKFKSLLGKSKLIRPKDRALISVEPGHASTALLHLLREGLDLDTPKKLRFEPVILFIEDMYHLTLAERTKLVEDITKHVAEFKFQTNLVPFEPFVFSKEVAICQDLLSLNLKETDKEKMETIFLKSTNTTNKKELLTIMKRNLLLIAAEKLDCQYVFTPELSVDIATNLLTNISLGKGSQVPDDTGFCDNRDPEVKILRPLRSLDTKEVAMYNVLNNLSPVPVRLEEFDGESVQQLTRKFINELQENYPAAVATVVRTGDKLAMERSDEQSKCQLCRGVILKKNAELSSTESTRFSKMLSNECPDRNLPGQKRFDIIKNKFEDRRQESSIYCYSCAKIAEYLLVE